MPFDVAFSLTTAERAAYVIAIGSLEGHMFDWAKFEWIKPAQSSE